MPLSRFQASSSFPGVSTDENFVAENQVVQGRWEKSQEFMGTIASSTVDALSDTTTTLRNGLLLGKDTNGELTQYDPASAAGSYAIDAVLVSDLNMLGTGGSVEDKHEGRLLVGGVIDPTSLIRGANAARGIVGDTYEYAIRKQMAVNGSFIFEDQPSECPLFNWKYESVDTTTTETLTDDEDPKSGRDLLHCNKGASGVINYTLPAGGHLKPMLAYYFYCEVDQNFTVTAGTADTILAPGTAGDTKHDTIVASTSNQKIGAAFACIADGASWKMYALSNATLVSAG